MAKIYNKRHIARKARDAGLNTQKELAQAMKSGKEDAK